MGIRVCECYADKTSNVVQSREAAVCIMLIRALILETKKTFNMFSAVFV